MMEEFNRQLLDRFEKEARDTANGDLEVESSILSSMMTAFDNDDYIIDDFYKSILLVSFSYYESILQIIDKQLTPSSIEDVVRRKQISLSPTLREDILFLNDTVKHVRNGISHNNAGTLKESQIQAIKDVSQQYKDIIYNSDTKEVVVSGPSFIFEILNKAQNVLRELAKSFGHNEIITTVGENK